MKQELEHAELFTRMMGVNLYLESAVKSKEPRVKVVFRTLADTKGLGRIVFSLVRRSSRA